MSKTKKIKLKSWKTEEERKIILRQAIQEINKKQGIDCIHFAKDEKDITKTPFGVSELDEILGGGIPEGFTVLWGAPQSGKSTLADYLITQTQKQDKIAYYIPLEPFDRERMQLFGVNLEKLVIGQFPKAEQALDSIIDFARKKLVDVIILDSIHALSPKGEQEERSGKEKSMEDDTMALLARKLSQFFRIAVDPIKRSGIKVLLIGQTRMNIGFIAFEKLTGGKALLHYSKLILHIRKGQKADAPTRKIKKIILDEEGEKKIKSITEVIGFDVSITIDKTQVSGTQPELTRIHLPYYFETGFEKKLPMEIKKEALEDSKGLLKELMSKRKRGRPKREE